MIAAKIGNASQRLVTIRSIRSEGDISPAFLRTVTLASTSSMKSYRSAAMMLSESSSYSNSHWRISCSMCPRSSSGRPSSSSTSSLRSKSLTANQRCLCSGCSCKATSSMCPNACSTPPLKRCVGRNCPFS